MPLAPKGLISFFTFVVFFLVLLSNPPLAIAKTSKKSSPHEVLIVHSDYQGYPWTDSLNVGISSVMSSSPLTINLQFEYLDSKRNRDNHYFEQLRELWNIKYDKRRIDLIIVCSNEAYDFVMLERNDLFLGIPIVFTSYIGFKTEMLNGKQPITGVAQETDIISTIDAALLLHPQTQKIVFVAPGAPPFRMAWLEGLDERYAKAVKIHTITAENTAQIDREINSLGEDIVIIPLNSVLKSNGTYIPFTQFVSHLSIERPFSVYALWDIALGHGVVGGKMVSGLSQGRVAAKLALQILQGTPVSDVPVVANSPNQYMFDWEAMQRFKISESDLPQQSIVINRPVTFYSENKTVVHVAIAIFCVLLLLILSLIGAIVYLRKAQKDLLISDRTLKDSEAQFKKLIMKSPLPMVITDQNQDISFFNDKFTELFGYTIEDISTAEEWWHRAYPDQEYREKVQNSWLVAIEKANATATDIEAQEWDLTIKDGSTRRCEFSMVPLKEISLIIMNDISKRLRDAEQKRIIEDQLTKRDFEYKQLFDSMSEMFQVVELIYDKDGKVVDYYYIQVNQSFEKLANKKKGELIGNRARDLFAIVENHWLETYEKVQRTGKRERYQNYSAELDKYYDINAWKIGDNLVAVTFRDITEQKKLEAELHQSQKMEAIGTLAGGIAHDFNNILGAILGHSEFIQQAVSADSSIRSDIDNVITSASRAADLVQQILTFSRKTSDRKDVLHPHLLVSEALKMLRSTIPSSVILEATIDPDCGMILANPTSIHQIVVNLCTNALHAMHENRGTLRVDLQRQRLSSTEMDGKTSLPPGDFVVLTVADNGQGMDSATIKRIFEPYFTTNELGDGTGLGLALVHGIIQDCNGFIDVQSNVGEGSTFKVFFPVDKEPASQPVVSVSKDKATRSAGNERILIVDDELLLVKINEKRLQALGYEVTGVTDSNEARSIFRNQPDHFDLLITDQTMPGLTGEELAQAVLEIKPTIPIIICTGHSDTFSKEKALSMGIKKYVFKPLTGDELLDAVREVLNTE